MFIIFSSLVISNVGTRKCYIRGNEMSNIGISGHLSTGTQTGNQVGQFNKHKQSQHTTKQRARDQSQAYVHNPAECEQHRAEYKGNGLNQGSGHR